MLKLYKCIDSGSEYCTCSLSDTKDCISCSHLRGDDFCDCTWNGVCILYEYIMKNGSQNNYRRDYKGQIVDKKFISNELYLLKIKLDNKLIRKLDTIGSYVFIRKDCNSSYYNTPMSVFDLDEHHIYIVYQEIGPKTKKINKGDTLIIKGPYWGGLIGTSDLSKKENCSIVIVARGIGQSSILLPIKKLYLKGNNIVLFLDQGKTSSLYCLDFMKGVNIKTILIDSLSNEGEKTLKNYIKGNPVDVLISAGADMVHRQMKTIIETIDKSIEWFVSNNSIICCGEGVCGACLKKIENGDRIKLCKTIIDPRNIY